jgi:hypothetical protein
MEVRNEGKYVWWFTKLNVGFFPFLFIYFYVLFFINYSSVRSTCRMEEATVSGGPWSSLGSERTVLDGKAMHL